MTRGPVGGIGTSHAMKIVNNVLAIRWFREAMAETLASGDHVEVVKLIGYSKGGRS